MRTLRLTLLLVSGFVLLMVLTFALQSAARSGPDRSSVIQAPLALFVLGSPVLSYLLRSRRERLRWVLLAAQIGCYLLYETGISVDTNIRVDLLLIHPLILLNAWLLFRPAPPPGATSARRPGWATFAGVLGILIALAGIAGSAVFVALPSFIRSARESIEETEANPGAIGADPEMQRRARERVEVPSWFTPYCVGLGVAGLIASGTYLWGARRLLQWKPNGPALFKRGASMHMLVATGIGASALLSSSVLLRENLGLAIGWLLANGLLWLMVRRYS